MPFLIWWPLGIHPSLYGTNYDLPVSHADFFATFAEIMDYPLPGPELCRYSFNSDNAHVHDQTASKIGRPGMSQPEITNPGRWIKERAYIFV